MILEAASAILPGWRNKFKDSEAVQVKKFKNPSAGWAPDLPYPGPAYFSFSWSVANMFSLFNALTIRLSITWSQKLPGCYNSSNTLATFLILKQACTLLHDSTTLLHFSRFLPLFKIINFFWVSVRDKSKTYNRRSANFHYAIPQHKLFVQCLWRENEQAWKSPLDFPITSNVLNNSKEVTEFNI